MSPLLLPITLATAGALGLIGLILALRVTMGRAKHKVNMGDGQPGHDRPHAHPRQLRRIRAADAGAPRAARAWRRQSDGTNGWRGDAGGGAYLPCDRHGRADGAACGRRDGHVYLARRQHHLRAQARTPAPERLSRSIAIPMRAAMQSSPASILAAHENRFANITKRRSE